MQEVFEKIVEDLKSLETPCELGMIENGRYILRDKAIEIVKQAALITSGEMCAICPFCKYYGTKDCYIENEGKHKNCDKGIMKWLQSEVEVGE